MYGVCELCTAAEEELSDALPARLPNGVLEQASPKDVRTSRSVSLTGAGEAFLERAQRTLRIMQRNVDENRSIGRGEVG